MGFPKPGKLLQVQPHHYCSPQYDSFLLQFMQVVVSCRFSHFLVFFLCDIACLGLDAPCFRECLGLGEGGSDYMDASNRKISYSAPITPRWLMVTMLKWTLPKAVFSPPLLPHSQLRVRPTCGSPSVGCPPHGEAKSWKDAGADRGLGQQLRLQLQRYDTHSYVNYKDCDFSAQRCWNDQNNYQNLQHLKKKKEKLFLKPALQLGLEVTFPVNRYCTLYIWFGAPVKQAVFL